MNVAGLKWKAQGHGSKIMTSSFANKWEAQVKGNTKFDRKLWADIAEDPSIREKRLWTASHGPIFSEAQLKGKKKSILILGQTKRTAK